MTEERVPPTNVSVIIPTFNRRIQVRAAVESALSQDLLALEVLVIDDGSTDGTLDDLRSISDERLRLLSNTRTKGPAGARNTGMLAAKGQFIAFLDSDDLFLPGHLSAVSHVFEREASVGLVYGRARYVQDGSSVPFMGPNLRRKIGLIRSQRDEGRYIVFSESLFDSMLDLGCFFNLSTVALRRSLPDASHLFDERLFGAEDYEYWQRLSAICLFAYLKDEQIIYTLHAGNISVSEAPEVVEKGFLEGIKVCRVFLEYEYLGRSSLVKIKRNLAQAIFDLGYLRREQGKIEAARREYVASMRIRFSLLAFRAYLKSYLLR